MSKKEKITDLPEQKEEKIVTRYDRKQQRKKEQEIKEARQKKITIGVSVVVLAVILGFILSFPIRNYLATTQAYIYVDGDKVTRTEFDYHYNASINTYYQQYGGYLSYMGLDLSGDLTQQMYSDTLTWKDFFDQMAVDSIKQNKAMINRANAAGFTYDTKEEYIQFEAAMKDMAAEQGISLSKYVKLRFGAYATSKRVAGYVKEGILVGAYYEQLLEEKAPTDEEAIAYYEENKDSYDSVDYRLTRVDAQFPSNESEESEEEEAEPYEPSEEEIEAAMKEAKTEADQAEADIFTSGELIENAQGASTNYTIREWLFEEGRKEGDTTVIEDSYNNCYYVVGFEDRYLDETPTVDARIILTETEDGQAILEEWQNGEATEESFIEIFKKYNEDVEYLQDEGGLYTGMITKDMAEVLGDWLAEEGRKPGDTVALTWDETHFVMYFVGHGTPVWMETIKETMLSTIMSEYLEEIVQEMEVKDPKGHVKVPEELEIESSSEDDNSDEDEASSNEESSSEEDGDDE